MFEAENFVALGFVIFLGLLVYLGAHRKVLDGIDNRKAREAEGEAASIVANAKAEAERLAVEAKARMEDFVVRRTKMAETKIAQAEAQALADVRAAAADTAVAAAERILGAAAKGKVAEDLLSRGIEDIKKRFN
jgi:F-type H+-transporting ATPase subunit b